MTKKLTGNELKIIAAFAMLIDHIGLIFFPTEQAFRIVGRLAFPIFAFMIAEGCEYTKHKLRYFLTVAVLAAVCQCFYYLFENSLYMCILVTFSLSIPTVYALQFFKESVLSGGTLKRIFGALVFLGAVFAVYTLNRFFEIDYGFWGCMTPVFASIFRNSHEKTDSIRINVLSMGICLVAVSVALGANQYYSLLALFLLFRYSGERGNRKMKYFFYIFYPAHLVVLHGISMLLQ